MRSARAEIVSHHLDAELSPGVDNPADRRLVGPAHHDDEIRARLGHHLGFEVTAVHRLQVGDDRMVGEPRAKAFDRPQPFGEDAAASPPRASRRRPRTPTAAVSSASSSEVRSRESWTIGWVRRSIAHGGQRTITSGRAKYREIP